MSAPLWRPGTRRDSRAALNKATRSLGLPTKAPACWTQSQEMWNQYRRDANFTAHDGFTYCTDCTAAHRDAMIMQDRCKYPGTTFVRNCGVVVGRRNKKRTVQ